MNGKQAKLIRKAATALSANYKRLKRAWVQQNHLERQKTAAGYRKVLLFVSMARKQ